MTVAELIEHLETLPEDFVVQVQGDGFLWENVQKRYIWMIDDLKKVRIG